MLILAHTWAHILIHYWHSDHEWPLTTKYYHQFNYETDENATAISWHSIQSKASLIYQSLKQSSCVSSKNIQSIYERTIPWASIKYIIASHTQSTLHSKFKRNGLRRALLAYHKLFNNSLVHYCGWTEVWYGFYSSHWKYIIISNQN